MRSRFRASTVLALLVLASGLGQGCGDITIPLPKQRATGPAWTDEQWPKLLADVKTKIGDDARLLRVEADYRSATFQAQDPKKPENVDAWKQEKGVLLGPIPVQLIGGGEIEPSLFTWSDVALAKIPELAKTALDRLALEGGEIVGIDVQRDFDPALEMKVAARKMHADLDRRLGKAEAASSGTGDPELDRALRENGQVQIKITVRGTRKMGGLTANARGEVTDVRTY